MAEEEADVDDVEEDEEADGEEEADAEPKEKDDEEKEDEEAEEDEEDKPLPTKTGSARKSIGRGSAKIGSVRGSGKIGSARGSGKIGSARGSIRPGLPVPGSPKPGPPKKKSFMDVLKRSTMSMFRAKPKSSKLQIPGQPPKKKQSLLAKITKSATSFVSAAFGFGKKKKPPPPPPRPPPPPKRRPPPPRARPKPPPRRPKPPRVIRSSALEEPEEEEDEEEDEVVDEDYHHEESERVLNVTELGRLPSKRVSNMLTNSVIENIAREVNKITAERQAFDEMMCERRRRADICGRCLHFPPPPPRMIMVPPTEFAGPLCTAPYPRRGVMELTRQFERPVPAYTVMTAPYSMPIEAPFPSPQLPHFPHGGPSFHPHFPPYPGGAMPFGFHPGMPSMPPSFGAPYRNSATRSWQHSPWTNAPFGSPFAPPPMPVHNFPKSPCEINPGICPSNVLICPCGCGRPIARPSFYR